MGWGLASGTAKSGDGLLQGEALLADDNIAEALVGRTIFVGGRGGGGEPAFVDPATVQAEGVEVIGVELQSFAGLEKRAGNPARREPKESAGFGESGFDQGFDVFGDGLEFFD